jgi:hypothetical protein
MGDVGRVTPDVGRGAKDVGCETWDRRRGTGDGGWEVWNVVLLSKVETSS